MGRIVDARPSGHVDNGTSPDVRWWRAMDETEDTNLLGRVGNLDSPCKRVHTARSGSQKTVSGMSRDRMIFFPPLIGNDVFFDPLISPTRPGVTGHPLGVFYNRGLVYEW